MPKQTHLTEKQLADLLNTGFLVLDDFLQPSTFLALQNEAKQLSYRAAKITDGLAENIRSDGIVWIDSQKQNMPQGQYFLTVLEQLSAQFNRHFFAGIRRVEAHFACYQAGKFYARHVDNPAGSSNRVFSCVYYMNTHWSSTDAGELMIYQSVNHTEKSQLVLPLANRLVIFDSNIAHEVKPATRTRYSIAAWLRKDD